MPSTPTRQPKLTLRKNGHATLAGLNYQDLRSLLTIASLYDYGDKPQYDDPSKSSMPDIVRRNNADNELYHRDQRLLLSYLNKLMSRAISSSNGRDEYVLLFDKYRQEENRYWFPLWCRNPEWPANDPGTEANTSWNAPAKKRNAPPPWPE
jgi:hypothetical protein